jgi:hypothetical protein
MFVPVAQWLPDQPPYNNPGGNSAFNVFPGRQCYLPVPSLQKVATGPTGRMLNLVNARDNANNNYTYCGDQSALYVRTGASLTAVNAVSITYSVAHNDTWEFVQWGQTMLATNGTDPLQQISLGAAHFVAVGGGAPTGRHISVINNFAVLGNVSDSALGVTRVRWSALNNVGSWTPDATTLADFQDLPTEGGWVQKIVGGEQGGYVFQERKIWAMNFVGSPLIFQFNPVHQNIGAFAPQSVINYGNLVYFLAADGFYEFNGTTINPIGQGKVDRTFFADLDSTNIANIRVAIWPQQKIVMWAYPGLGNNGGKPNHILCYSWAYESWSRIDMPNTLDSGAVECLGLIATPGVTLEGLDAYCGSNIDALVFSLDDLSWTGGQLIFGAFVAGSLYYFNGAAMSATVETSEMNPQAQLYQNAMNQTNDNVQMLSQINQVVPVASGISGGALQVQIASRYNITQNSSYGAALSPNSAGFCQSRVTNRFFRFLIKTSGQNFDFLQGVDIQFSNAGQR